MKGRSGIWGYRHWLALVSLAWVFAALLVLPGCSQPVEPTPVVVASPIPTCVVTITVNGNGDTTVNGCGNVTIVQPSPSPSPGAGSGESDVKGLGQFFYGWAQSTGPSCPTFNEANKHKDPGADFTILAGCEAAITCTAFSDKDEDKDGKPDQAKDPSRDIKWSSAGPVSLAQKGEELLFNRFVTATGSGIATITCDYVDSADKLHTSSKTYSVHGS